MIKEMKYRFNVFYIIIAVISAAMFTTCKDDKDTESSPLSLDQENIDVLAVGGTTLISVGTGMSWNASVDVDWINLSPASGNGSGMVTVTIDKLEAGMRRTGIVTFTAGSAVKTTTVVQRSNLESDYYTTGDAIRLNRHTVGSGIAIVIIGDGFDREDCKKGGVFEYNSRKLGELFLSMPVVRDFRSYFDVYARVDVSRDRGVRNCVANVDNCPDNVYLSGHPEINFGKASENARQTAGRDDYWFIFMGNGMIGGYAMGNMAVYSANEGTKPYWMMHEFAGHAFGGFPDLYYLGEEGMLDAKARKAFDDNHEGGELLMLDWPTDPATVYWKDFIGKNGYEMVGIYPAGYYDPPLAFGQIQSCEDIFTSVMYGPTAHYTVMERYQLWRKIQQRAGFTTITIDEFIAYDVVNVVDADVSWDRYDNWTDDRIWNGEYYEYPGEFTGQVKDNPVPNGD
jgi:hypothetical protein